MGWADDSIWISWLEWVLGDRVVRTQFVNKDGHMVRVKATRLQATICLDGATYTIGNPQANTGSLMLSI